MEQQKQLSEEDMRRVELYLQSSINQVERKPFRPWALLLGWFVIVSLLSVVSLWYAWYKGVLPLPAFLAPFVN